MTDEKKGEQAPRDVAADERADREARSEEIDAREEDGWTQPESSAQKQPPGAPDPTPE